MTKITVGWLNEMLTLTENVWFDFKEKYKEVNVDLIHDILCLLNSNHEGDRFLIVGIQDKTKKIIGVEKDPNRKSQQQLSDMLRAKNFNKIPPISLETIIVDGHEVDVIKIKNEKQKPYFLVKDFKEREKEIRAGVVYTRIGDTNTPVRESADNAQIKKMWREQFLIDAPPKEKVSNYLKDYTNWSQGEDAKGQELFYYDLDDTYSVVILTSEGQNIFDEPWAVEYPDGRAIRKDIAVKVSGNIIFKSNLIWLDGCRAARIMPKIVILDKSDSETVRGYYYLKDSLDLLLDKMIHSIYFDSGRTNRKEDFPFFESEDEADVELKANYQNDLKKYSFYRVNVEGILKNESGRNFKIIRM